MAEIKGMQQLTAKLDKAIADGPREVERALLRGGLIIAEEAQRNVMGPRPGHLGVVSNRLRTALGAKKIATLTVKAGFLRPVVYGPIHEFGGEIHPKKPGGFLRFKGYDGQMVFVKMVRMPARPYMRPAFVSKKDAATNEVRKVYTGILKIGGVSV